MNKPFIVAEIGGNHGGSVLRAVELIEAAGRAGVDAVKFQCFTPEQMAPADKIIEAGPWAGRLAVSLYREIHTPREWLQSLFAHAQMCGLVAFSSVFHPDDVDFLETMDCPIYKIASFEVLDTGLIWKAASTKKPMMISTGMATLGEMAQAVNAVKSAGNILLTMLKCTSAYPADASEANLRTMVDMRTMLGCDVGLSDHSPGIGVAVAAAALGASVIEKHLTLSRADGGPDAGFSMEPDEFALMVTECRRAAAAIGQVTYGPTTGEAAQLLLRRKPGGKRGD